MNKIQSALLLALLTSFAGTAQAQSTPPPLPEGAKEEPAKKTLLPGVLPEGTSAKAKALWNSLTEATLVAGQDRQPVTSFRLQFDLRIQPDDRTSNDVHATYSFLAKKNYVRFSLESGREFLRGPDGNFSVTSDGEKILLAGRDYITDRTQIDDAARIAKNFVALTDPGRLRIARLSAIAKAPSGLPEKMQKRAAKLTWIEVVSPDFHLNRSGAAKRKSAGLYRVLLGLDPKTHRIELAELREEGLSETDPILIHFENYEAMDGFQIPRHLKFYEPAPATRPRVFRKKPTSDLYLLADRGTLRANLKPADFKP